MQPALKSEQAVQSYIDAMLLDMHDATASQTEAPCAPHRDPSDTTAPARTAAVAAQAVLNDAKLPDQSHMQVATRQAASLPGQQLPLASALVMPGLAKLQLKALVQAIAQAPASTGLAPIQGHTGVEQTDAVPTAQLSATGLSADPGQVVPAASAISSEKAQDNPRSAAFLKHLQDAQARTAVRRKAGTAGQKRPAALMKAPAWVQDEQLRCLVFKVANLQLALPIQYLSGVEPLDVQQLHALPAEDLHSEFATLCLGAKGDNLVLDTARLVMPERYSPDMAGQYRQALKISDTNWYFAVDSIGSERSFNAQDVRWRSQHTRREWLAGTVIDQMCAIVDVESLHRSLLAASVLEASPQ
ncbi:MAG: hypothetical protein HKO84_01610 [Pseudomonadales bacterium]|nr:hypothetical protein [Pseudomonadales bacterium]